MRRHIDWPHAFSVFAVGDPKGAAHEDDDVNLGLESTEESHTKLFHPLLCLFISQTKFPFRWKI